VSPTPESEAYVFLWKTDNKLPEYAASNPTKITLYIAPKRRYPCTVPYTVSDAEDGWKIFPQKKILHIYQNRNCHVQRT
jgi:hypothetical protein